MKFLKVLFVIILILLVFWLIVNLIPLNKVVESNSWMKTDKTMISAHRGGSQLNPENSEKAFDHVILETNYVDIVEIDVQYTKDRVLVINHDNSVNKMALDESEETVNIADCTFEELQNYNIGRNFVSRDGLTPYKNLTIDEAKKQGLTIMSLEEFLTKYQNTRDFKLYLEIKPKGENGIKIADEVNELLNSSKYSWWKDRTMIISFGDATIDYIIANYPEQYVGALGYKIAPQLILNKLGLNALVKIDYQCLQLSMTQTYGPLTVDFATQSMVDSCHNHNQAITYWTINERSDMEYLVGLGVDVITTDAPDILYEVINSQK